MRRARRTSRSVPRHRSAGVQRSPAVGHAARASAWCVHGFTAFGLVLAAAAVVLIVRGDAAALRLALLALLAAMAIDAVDGTLARRFRVHHVLPAFHGRTLDDIVDFHTYTSVPLLLLWRVDALPGAWTWLLLAPLLTSAFAFSRADAKTADGYFLGFPSYWNVVALYVFLLAPPPLLTAGLLLLLAVLTLVPTAYLYPSMGGRLNAITAAAGVVWGAVVTLVLLQALPQPHVWTWLSLAFPAWYMAASWAAHLRRHVSSPPAAPRTSTR